MNTSIPQLSFNTIEEEVAPYLKVVLLFLMLDKASANERLEKEIWEIFKDRPKVLLFSCWCLGHSCGNALADLLRVSDVIDMMYAWSKLLGNIAPLQSSVSLSSSISLTACHGKLSEGVCWGFLRHLYAQTK